MIRVSSHRDVSRKCVECIYLHLVSHTSSERLVKTGTDRTRTISGQRSSKKKSSQSNLYIQIASFYEYLYIDSFRLIVQQCKSDITFVFNLFVSLLACLFLCIQQIFCSMIQFIRYFRVFIVSLHPPTRPPPPPTIKAMVLLREKAMVYYF